MAKYAQPSPQLGLGITFGRIVWLEELLALSSIEFWDMNWLGMLIMESSLNQIISTEVKTYEFGLT